MIKGIGTDILAVSRIRNLVENNPDDSFIKKTFTEAEIKLAESRFDPAMCFATRFAAKEAIFKSLHIDGNTVRLNEIEILEGEFGRPYVNLYGKVKELSDNLNIKEVEVSLSYETDYALAFAVVY